MRMIEMTSWLIEKTNGVQQPFDTQPRNMKGQLA